MPGARGGAVTDLDDVRGGQEPGPGRRSHQGIAVQTANDGCLIIAEGLAGSEAKFVERMNARAAELGLGDSHFGNATGLPHPDNRSTLFDLVTLSRHLVETYPELYQIFRLPEFEWNKILQRNRNPLLSFGADGLGTGFAEGSGFALVASAERNGRRLFLGLGGLATDKERTGRSHAAAELGFRQLRDAHAVQAGEVIGEASVYGGAQSTVPLVSAKPVEVYVPSTIPSGCRRASSIDGRSIRRWRPMRRLRRSTCFRVNGRSSAYP